MWFHLARPSRRPMQCGFEPGVSVKITTSEQTCSQGWVCIGVTWWGGGAFTHTGPQSNGRSSLHFRTDEPLTLLLPLGVPALGLQARSPSRP